MIPEDYTFMASNSIFIALGIQDKYLEKAALIKSGLPSGSYKTSLDTSSPPRSLSLHCKQINKVKNELDRYHQVCWLPCMFLFIKQPFLQSIWCF